MVGEKQAAAADAVALTPETVEVIRKVVQEVVKESVSSVMTEKNAMLFWRAGIKMLQVEAKEGASNFVVWSVKQVAARTAMFLIAGGVIYAVGGWELLFSFLKKMSPLAIK